MNDFTVREPELDIHYQYGQHSLVIPAHMNENGNVRWPLHGGKRAKNREEAVKHIKKLGGVLK